MIRAISASFSPLRASCQTPRPTRIARADEGGEAGGDQAAQAGGAVGGGHARKRPCSALLANWTAARSPFRGRTSNRLKPMARVPATRAWTQIGGS